MAQHALDSGKALERLIAMVEAQGGDVSVIKDTGKFPKAPFEHPVFAEKTGYITSMNAESCGIASAMLGAGRETKESQLDYAAGIIINSKTGDYVKEGQIIATLYASDESLFAAAEKRYLEAIQIGGEKPDEKPLIYARVTKETVEKLF